MVLCNFILVNSCNDRLREKDKIFYIWWTKIISEKDIMIIMTCINEMMLFKDLYCFKFERFTNHIVRKHVLMQKVFNHVYRYRYDSNQCNQIFFFWQKLIFSISCLPFLITFLGIHLQWISRGKGWPSFFPNNAMFCSLSPSFFLS